MFWKRRERKRREEERGNKRGKKEMHVRKRALRRNSSTANSPQEIHCMVLDDDVLMGVAGVKQSRERDGCVDCGLCATYELNNIVLVAEEKGGETKKGRQKRLPWHPD